MPLRKKSDTSAKDSVSDFSTVNPHRAHLDINPTSRSTLYAPIPSSGTAGRTQHLTESLCAALRTEAVQRVYSALRKHVLVGADLGGCRQAVCSLRCNPFTLCRTTSSTRTVLTHSERHRKRSKHTSRASAAACALADAASIAPLNRPPTPPAGPGESHARRRPRGST